MTAAVLHLSHTLRGRHLTVDVAVPKSVPGPLTITLAAFHGRRLLARIRRRVAVKDARARVRLTLSTQERAATRLYVTAAAAHARTTTVVLK